MSRPVENWELSAYVDGDLPAERMTEIDAEAERSPELWHRLSQILADHRALMALGASQRDEIEDAPQRLARLGAQLTAQIGQPKRPRSALVAVRQWRHLAVLCAGAAFGWAAASWAAPHVDALSEFIDEAAEIHRVAVMAPGFSQEVSGPLLDGLGALFAHTITPPDLSGAGFALSRVNIAATDTGPAAVLYYTDLEARRVSLVLSLDSPILDALGRGAPGQAGAAPRVTTHDGFAVSFGGGGGIAYALVGSIPEPRARQLALRVAESLTR